MSQILTSVLHLFISGGGINRFWIYKRPHIVYIYNENAWAFTHLARPLNAQSFCPKVPLLWCRGRLPLLTDIGPLVHHGEQRRLMVHKVVLYLEVVESKSTKPTQTDTIVRMLTPKKICLCLNLDLPLAYLILLGDYMCFFLTKIRVSLDQESRVVEGIKVYLGRGRRVDISFLEQE